MRNNKFVAVWGMLLLFPAMGLRATVLTPQSKLWLVGDSSLHAYSSTSKKIDATIEFKPTESGKTASQSLYEQIKNGDMRVLDVSIPVKELKSGEKGLDKNMSKALKAEENPLIQFHMSSYKTAASSATPSGFLIMATGQLSIAGVEKTVEIDATATNENGGARIQGTKDLLMTDYGVKPPTLFVIRTRDRVVIHFDLTMVEGEK